VEHGAEARALGVIVDDELSAEKSGIWSTGLEDSVCLSVVKAFTAPSIQAKASLRRRHVSGAAMEPKSRMHLQ
jgi:hypothetical protein